MNEDIDFTISKLVQQNIKLKELDEIAPFIGSEEFTFQYNLTEGIQIVTKDLAREKLLSTISDIIDDENINDKRGKLFRINGLALKSIAACFLVICGIAIIYNTTGYNVESKYTKTYVKR